MMLKSSSEKLKDGESLTHFGVRGMRWGRKRATTPDGERTSSSDFPSDRVQVIDRSNSLRLPRPNVKRAIGITLAAPVLAGIGLVFAAKILTNSGKFQAGLVGAVAAGMPHRDQGARTARTARATRMGRKFTKDVLLKRIGGSSVTNLKAVTSGSLMTPVRAITAGTGKKLTDDVLIGRIGGVRITDLNK